MLPDAGIAWPLTRLLLIAGIGLGIGASVTFASSTIMGAAPPDRGGMAASIEEVGFELGNSLGVAVFGSVMTLAYSWTLALPDAPVPDALQAVVRDSLDEALRIADSLPAATAMRCGLPPAAPLATRCRQCWSAWRCCGRRRAR